jgi:hypothetical protein
MTKVLVDLLLGMHDQCHPRVGREDGRAPGELVLMPDVVLVAPSDGFAVAAAQCDDKVLHPSEMALVTGNAHFKRGASAEALKDRHCGICRAIIGDYEFIGQPELARETFQLRLQKGGAVESGHCHRDCDHGITPAMEASSRQ